jgi:hypothetical protein
MHSILFSSVKEHLTYCRAVFLDVKRLNSVGLSDMMRRCVLDRRPEAAQHRAQGATCEVTWPGAPVQPTIHYTLYSPLASWSNNGHTLQLTVQCPAGSLHNAGHQCLVFWRCPRSANICHTFPAILTVCALMCLKVTIHLVRQCTSNIAVCWGQVVLLSMFSMHLAHPSLTLHKSLLFIHSAEPYMA